MGRLLGGLKDFSGAQLGGFAIKGALDRAGVAPEQVQYVIMGQVLTAGAGQIPARQAAVNAGIPMSVPALTVNKVCLSGLDAIALADQLIRAGEFDIVVAGGQESMTQAPHLLPKSRSGFKYGDVTMLDHMAYDGLFCAFDQVAMGASTEKYNSRYGITREQQDAFSARSHQRAAEAIRNGYFADEIAPVSIPQRVRLRRSPTAPPRSWWPARRRPRSSASRRSPRSARTASSPDRTRACTNSRRTPSSPRWRRRT
jgi:acetyl-CoA C-acetyltransferase